MMDEEVVAEVKTNGNKPDQAEVQEGHNELFVRNLAYKTTDDSLFNFFSAYGTVTKTKVLTKPDGSSKGIGFVEFSSNEEAKAALDDAANLNVDGREVQVNYSGQKGGDTGNRGGNKSDSWGGNKGGAGSWGGNSRSGGGDGGDKHTAFIGNLSFKTNEIALKKFFKECGGIVDVRIAKDRDTGKIKGFAHVDFESADGLQQAIAKNGSELEGRELKIDASANKSGGSGGRGGYGGGRGGGRGGYGGGRGGGRGGYGRGGGDPMQRAQKSGAIVQNSGNNVKTFNDDDD